MNTHPTSNNQHVKSVMQSIPSPFHHDIFDVFRHGIYDDEDIDVMINQQGDFAYLWPQPQMDYSHYVPRVKKLGLKQYKAKLAVYTRRFSKISSYFTHSESVLDIGAGDGLFLQIVKEHVSQLQLTACEKDQHTLEARQSVVGNDTFENLEDIVATDRKFSVVTLFHVLEHILEPEHFLKTIRSFLTPESILIIEIPSLNCPLLTLYQSEAYQRFYFQHQHPFNYSHTSLQRLMEVFGFSTSELISFQRYGLENHLTWLTSGKPGGNATFHAIFTRSSHSYLADLEQAGQTDSAIWVGKLAKKNSGEVV